MDSASWSPPPLAPFSPGNEIVAMRSPAPLELSVPVGLIMVSTIGQEHKGSVPVWRQALNTEGELPPLSPPLLSS